MDNEKPIDHRQILALWPSIPDVARDVGFNYVAVWRWNDRNYIPPEWWCVLIQCAHDRDIDITFKLLAETVRKKRVKKNPTGESG